MLQHSQCYLLSQAVCRILQFAPYLKDNDQAKVLLMWELIHGKTRGGWLDRPLSKTNYVATYAGRASVGISQIYRQHRDRYDDGMRLVHSIAEGICAALQRALYSIADGTMSPEAWEVLVVENTETLKAFVAEVYHRYPKPANPRPIVAEFPDDQRPSVAHRRRTTVNLQDIDIERGN